MRWLFGWLKAQLFRRPPMTPDAEIHRRQQRADQQERKLRQQQHEFEDLRELVRRRVRGLRDS